MAASPVVRGFCGNDISVSHSAGEGGTCWVTFSGWGRNTAGFGEKFFVKGNIPAIHVLSAWSHWWQTSELPAALACVRDLLRAKSARSVVVYGASMGGYGAALCSGWLGADVAILIAPQFTVDPGKPPHDTRWAKEARHIRFVQDDMDSQISPRARKYVIHDPFDPDARHAALYARHPNTTLVKIPFGSHVPGHVLAETRLLQPLISDLAADQFDRCAFRADLRRRRASSKTYWRSMAELCERKRPALALRALHRAIELAPGDGRLAALTSALHVRQGRLADAVAEAERAAGLAAQDTAVLGHLAGLYATARRIDDAERVTRRALQLQPDSVDLLRRLSHICLIKKQGGDALNFAEQAVGLDPHEVASHAHLAGVLAQLGDVAAALDAARRGLAIDPGHVACLRIAASMARRAERLDEALAFAERGRALRPDDPVFAGLATTPR